MNDEQTFWMAEYKNVSDQFQRSLDMYIKTFLIYIGILGMLLKFALDRNASSELRVALILFGLLCTVLLFVCVFYAERMTKRLRRKRRKALEQLGRDTEDEFTALHWASIIFSIFNVFAIIGWVFILVCYR